jgi:hypothetical protein
LELDVHGHRRRLRRRLNYVRFTELLAKYRALSGADTLAPRPAPGAPGQDNCADTGVGARSRL